MGILDMSFLGSLIILIIIAARRLGKNLLPKSACTVLWAIALVRLLTPLRLDLGVRLFPPPSPAVLMPTLVYTPAPGSRPLGPRAERGFFPFHMARRNMLRHYLFYHILHKEALSPAGRPSARVQPVHQGLAAR